MTEQQRHRTVMGRTDVKEVVDLTVDRGAELGVGVEPSLQRAPIEGPPALNRVAQVAVRRTLLPAGVRHLSGVSGAVEAIVQVLQRRVRDVHFEWREGEGCVVHALHRMNSSGTFRSYIGLATSSRLLELLGLLQSRPVLTGPELVARLDVTDRTLRKDVARLRDLGYPVDSVRGPGGGYRLGVSGQLPPLLLTDDEAVAVAVGLSFLGAVPGLADAGQSAQGKLERTLPGALRRRVAAVNASVEVGPADTATNASTPVVDPEQMSRIATAITALEGIRFSYRDEDRARTLDPYRLVNWQQRWYLVGRIRPSGDWRVYRTDLMQLRSLGATRFTAQPLDGGDYAALVLRTVASTGWMVHARIAVDAPADEVLARINPAVGVVEALDEERSVLATGADTLETVAVYIGMLGLDFHVNEPPELVDHLRRLARRYTAALPN